jgi:D-sedoheptulose 7-phosphate isomerase
MDTASAKSRENKPPQPQPNTVTPPPFEDAIKELETVLQQTRSLAQTVDETGECLVRALSAGNKIFTCGNGGSAADALHMAEELTGRYLRERRALPAICLNADVTALTCIGNDYGFEHIFARQLEALGQAGDVLVAFSTSGNSPNIIRCLQTAHRLGMQSVLLSGKDGGAAKQGCDTPIIVPSNTTARIQEVHTLIMHQWLERVDLHFTTTS